ncbi:MAG: LysR family transcriptional regulator [Myxococcales bacterium]|nr:LysR family transcriptional regulator [Myxococcales bacterium]
MPDLESLRCFEAAAAHGSFRVAAASVGLSPAAFSDRIRRLEELLDVRLFDRSTRSVRITTAGERLLPQARETLENARRCVTVAREDARPPFDLSLGTRYELGLSWLVPALGELRADRPERTLHLQFGDGPDLIEKLERGRLDALVSSTRLTRADLDYALLHEEHYAFVTCKALARSLLRPEQARTAVLVDTLADLPLFRYFQDARPAEEVWAFADRELVGTIAAVRLRLLAGAGVAVLPRYFIEADLRAGTLSELHRRTPPHSDYFRLIWRRGHRLTPEFQLLATSLRRLPLR